jgi:hypothetical protein
VAIDLRLDLLENFFPKVHGRKHNR